VLAVCAATAAAAESRVTFDRPVDDETFYRAVACGAPAGGDCAGPFVRWSPRDAADVVIAVGRTEPGFAAVHGRAGERALDRAIAEINGAGAALRLRRDDGARRPDIVVVFSDIAEGEEILAPDLRIPRGETMGAAYVYLWWNDRRFLTRGAILVSRSIWPEEMGPVVLEELTQAMGLLTDIEGQAYADSSVFSETSNAVRRLSRQDRAALRLHYPGR
jgi:hypothetical protein